MRFVRPAVALALILSLPTLSDPASAAPPAQQKPATTLQVFSRETVVDVSVTDAQGNPVRGLTKEDFTVMEDNKAQAIKSFEEFTGNRATTEPLPKLPPHVYTNLQPPPAGNALNLLLLDGLNTAPPDATDPDQTSWSFAIQAQVKKGAQKFVNTMPPGTRVVVLGLSRGLRILQGVSSDPALLSAAIDTMDMNMDGRGNTIPQWCAMQDTRDRMTMEALNQIAADTTAIKGKKNLIWYSAGFPTITDSRVNATAGGKVFTETNPEGKTINTPSPIQGCLPDYSQDLLKTYGLLAAAQITVYPIGARILGSNIANPVGPGPLFDPTESIPYGEAVADEEFSLEAMADATGGKAFYNTNDLGAAAVQAAGDGANYYTLSYVPPGKKYDWGHHKIKIEVDQPGLHLTYRQTYDAVDPATIRPAPGLTLVQTAAEDAPIDIRVAMGRSMPTSTQILFDVQVEPSTAPLNPNEPPGTILGTLDPAVKAKLKDKPLTRYGFQYAVPARQFPFVNAPDGSHKSSIDFDIAVYDAEGKLVTGLSQSVKMSITPERFPQFIQGPIRFLQQIDLPPGALFLRIGVLDPAANKIGTLEIPLTVPSK